jgi:diaminopimelate epimerase
MLSSSSRRLKTNANFAQVIAPDTLLLRTYERGVEGETLACGTGVCATALLHAVETGAESPIHVKVRGSDTLRVDFQKNPDGSFAAAKLTGPADFVFEGTISL